MPARNSLISGVKPHTYICLAVVDSLFCCSVFFFTGKAMESGVREPVICILWRIHRFSLHDDEDGPTQRVTKVRTFSLAAATTLWPLPPSVVAVVLVMNCLY